MIISFSASVTGINTLLSKKFAWKINDLSTENLVDPVLNYTEYACSTIASFSGPKRRRRTGLVSAVRACANRGGIPPPPHTIDILPYTRDARIDTKRNTVRRFMVAKYGMQETHSIVLIQRLI